MVRMVVRAMCTLTQIASHSEQLPDIQSVVHTVAITILLHDHHHHHHKKPPPKDVKTADLGWSSARNASDVRGHRRHSAAALTRRYLLVCSERILRIACSFFSFLFGDCNSCLHRERETCSAVSHTGHLCSHPLSLSPSPN